MTLKEELIYLENIDNHDSIITKNGSLPIIITAPHTMEQQDAYGNIKHSEPFTKAIALYLSEKLNTYALVKIKDTGIDANKDIEEEFKNKLVDIINKNQILLSIDIHGASITRDFAVEIGTVNNLSSDFSTINELKEAFIENGIKNVKIDDPFKGGAITRTVYGKTNSESIQIEINREYRDVNEIDKIEKILQSLESFIKQYIDTINKSID